VISIWNGVSEGGAAFYASPPFQLDDFLQHAAGPNSCADGFDTLQQAAGSFVLSGVKFPQHGFNWQLASNCKMLCQLAEGRFIDPPMGKSLQR
jgi:hypothetical protein